MANEKKGNLVDKAYDVLRKKILSMEFKPGDYLNEKALMKELKVGRTPLRQAIILLKENSLVEQEPHRSPYIKEYSLFEVKELFESLIVLEKNVTYLACHRITDSAINKLTKIQDKIDELIQNKDLWEFNNYKINNYNLEFHKTIADASNNRFLAKMHRDIRTRINRLAYIPVSEDENGDLDREKHKQMILEDHHNILKCLKNRDSKKIETVSIDHVNRFQKRITNFLMKVDYI